MFTSISLMAQNPATQKIKVLTSNEHVVEIPKNIALQFSVIKNIIGDLGQSDEGIPLPNVTQKNLLLIIKIVERINALPEQGTLKREDGRYIAQRIQPAIVRALRDTNDQDIVQMIPAAEYLDAESIVNGAIRIAVHRYLAQHPNATIPTITNQLFQNVNLPHRVKKLIEYQYWLLKNNPIPELSVADYIAIHGMPKVEKNQFIGHTYELLLSNKDLTSLEGLDQITSHTLVEYIDVSKNKLRYLAGDSFKELPALKRINASSNELSDVHDNLFKNLTNLKAIDLTKNKLKALPEALFNGLTQLTRLSLSENKLTTLPDGIFNSLGNLESLNLPKNQLAVLPTVVFNGLINLKELNLSDNQLTILQDGLFNNLTKLQGLELGGNKLTSLPAAVFSRLQSIKSIILNENRLNSIPVNLFHNLTTLQQIHLNDNEIRVLTPEMFRGLTHLAILGIKGLPGFKNTQSYDIRIQLQLPENVEFM